jgi:AbrB family looped-hinge helix DNA binding protein
MTYKVGAKGQVVLPKDIRDRLGIRPGDEVTVDEDGEEIRIRRADTSAPLRGMLRDDDDPLLLTQALEADHRWEIAHDEMREAEREIRDVSRRAR